MKIEDKLRIARASLQAQKDENEGLRKYIEKLRTDLKEKEAPSSVPFNGVLDALLEVVRGIRKSDCGAWLKDCNGIHHCSEGREKRQELMRLLDKLYKAASI